MKKKVVIVSGGFDPLHSGHVEYLYAARALGDQLIVGANSDGWLKRKKGAAFLPIKERLTILRALRPVDIAIPFQDDDGSACGLINYVLEMYGVLYVLDGGIQEFIFANGGDRTDENIPEIHRFKNRQDLKFVFGVGGSKKLNSSSDILRKWEQRNWTSY
jgi:D-beta-D-heptose 7-phosphate kinase/D-beta-D-heptose 1-phosphate adenosyltransferase